MRARRLPPTIAQALGSRRQGSGLRESPRAALGRPRARRTVSSVVIRTLFRPQLQWRAFKSARTAGTISDWAFTLRFGLRRLAAGPFLILHFALVLFPAPPSRPLRFRRQPRQRVSRRRAKGRHGFGPRPMTDSPLSARSTPLHDPLRRLRGRFASFRRPQTGETVKNIRAHPKTPEAARLRPARTSITARGFACRRGPEVARDASHGQDLSNSREHGQLSLARNWPSSLTKTKLV